MYFVCSNKCFIRCGVQSGDSEKELFTSKASEIFLNKTWNSDFWLIVNKIWRKNQHLGELGLYLPFNVIVRLYSLLHK